MNDNTIERTNVTGDLGSEIRSGKAGLQLGATETHDHWAII